MAGVTCSASPQNRFIVAEVKMASGRWQLRLQDGEQQLKARSIAAWSSHQLGPHDSVEQLTAEAQRWRGSAES